jgi:serine/threonine-protein kinase
LIARLTVDQPSMTSAFESVVREWHTTHQRSTERDVMVGSAGALLAWSEIAAVDPALVDERFVHEAHASTLDAARSLTGSARRGGGALLGFAHGVAGYLFALHMGRAAFRLPFPARLRTQMTNLLARERLRPSDDADWSLWPLRAGDAMPTMNGWCHGTPGVALALLGCAHLSGDEDLHELACEGLNGTMRLTDTSGSFCCGAAGRAQILLEGHRLLGEKRWLERATSIAEHLRHVVTAGEPFAAGLHKGRLAAEFLQLRLNDSRVALPGMGILSATSLESR